MPQIFFITHPEVAIDPQTPVNEWQLSEEGRERAERLLAQKWIQSVELIYSSEELKAHQTAEIIAQPLQLTVQARSKLGEVDRSSTGYLPERELEKTVKEFFENQDKSIAGWESAIEAQNRIVTCVQNIIETNPTSNIAFVSHGMVGCLLICHLKHVPIHRRYMQKSLGSYFIYDTKEKEVIQEWRSVDQVGR